VACLVVYFFLYESVSLSLENVDAMYGQPQLKAWTSHKWMPEGYVTRMQRDDDYFHRRQHAGDLDDRSTAVPSRGTGSEAEKKRSDDSMAFQGREERHEHVHRAV
jgi:SP family sugar:H+ symporter-like MFS transporter